MAKLVIFFNHKSLLGKLTKIFTGSYAYHSAWVCEDHDKIFDMYLIRRKRIWSEIKPGKTYKEYDFPFVTYRYLNTMCYIDKSTYGIIDYLLFSIRPIYHLFGKYTRNMDGKICSEMCNEDLIKCGYLTPWNMNIEPPSPADLDQWARKK